VHASSVPSVRVDGLLDPAAHIVFDINGSAAAQRNFLAGSNQVTFLKKFRAARSACWWYALRLQATDQPKIRVSRPPG
jgi:hypothetical protein